MGSVTSDKDSMIQEQMIYFCVLLLQLLFGSQGDSASLLHPGTKWTTELPHFTVNTVLVNFKD